MLFLHLKSREVCDFNAMKAFVASQTVKSPNFHTGDNNTDAWLLELYVMRQRDIQSSIESRLSVTVPKGCLAIPTVWQ